MEGIVVFNATFNTIPVISWWSVLLLEVTRVPGENIKMELTIGKQDPYLPIMCILTVHKNLLWITDGSKVRRHKKE